LAGSQTLSVSSGAAVTFYDGDNSFTKTGTLESVASFTSTTAASGSAYSNVAVGDKLFIGSVDTGITVTSKGSETSGGVTTYTFNLSSSASFTTSDTAVTFKHPLAMTLITPEGTEIPVTGASNLKASNEKLTTTTSQVEVYAAIDGNFIGSNSSYTSNRQADAEVPGGIKTVAKLSFMGGENIDTIVKDSMAGSPIFSTSTKLTSRLNNQAGGSTDLIFDLDLSGTQLHAGAFQITKSIQNGEAVSRLTNVTVDNAGRIVGVYGTGKQQYIGQVAMVSFDNEEGLIPVGKNAFAASNITGTEKDGTGVTVGRAGTGVLGEIRSQALESSNVDLANELVRLMVLQRSYSANSQSLKAVDQTLRDTLQMVG
jgi:flagellar hook protein FlgE